MKFLPGWGFWQIVPHPFEQHIWLPLQSEERLHWCMHIPTVSGLSRGHLGSSSVINNHNHNCSAFLWKPALREEFLAAYLLTCDKLFHNRWSNRQFPLACNLCLKSIHDGMILGMVLPSDMLDLSLRCGNFRREALNHSVIKIFLNYMYQIIIWLNLPTGG